MITKRVGIVLLFISMKPAMTASGPFLPSSTTKIIEDLDIEAEDHVADETR